MSIRDIVRRERWEMNRCAHEAELALLNEQEDVPADDGWQQLLEGVVDNLNADLRERFAR